MPKPRMKDDAVSELTPALYPIAKLRPDAKNPRTHPPGQIDQLAASMKEFGIRAPIMARVDDTIVFGHGRALAAAKLGIVEYPVIRAPAGWSDEKCRAYMIADNQHALNSDWDIDLLREGVEALQAMNFNFDALGFNDTGLHHLFGVDPDLLVAAEEAPPRLARPYVKRGELWVLGEHRLLCGDSTVADDVAFAVALEQPHLMVTDPPYGVNYDPEWRNKTDRANGKPLGARAVGRVTNDHRSDWRQAWDLFSGAVAYVWHPPGAKQVDFYSGLVSSGFEIRMQIIWRKSHFPIGRGHYHVQHEPCWYAVRNGCVAHWAGGRKQSTVWDIDKPQKSETGHSTQKPIECMARPIRNNSKVGDWVYDPFLGSGTTLIAAEIEKRRCVGVEIDPGYCDIVIQRFENTFGKTATRAYDGASYREVKEAAGQ